MDNRQVQLERANHVLTAMGVDTRNAKVMDRTQYITFDAKGKSSVVLLIDSNTKKLVGETSFDANKLNKGRYFVVDSARVLVEDQAGSLKEAHWKSEAHPAVLNSEFKIAQDEDLLLLPLSDLVYTKITQVVLPQLQLLCQRKKSTFLGNFHRELMYQTLRLSSSVSN